MNKTTKYHFGPTIINMNLYQKFKKVICDYLNHVPSNTKQSKKIEVNAYKLNIQTDVSAYELYQLTHQKVFVSYSKRDEWYNNLSDLCKRHVIKYKELVDYNKIYV